MICVHCCWGALVVKVVLQNYILLIFRVWGYRKKSHAAKACGVKWQTTLVAFKTKIRKISRHRTLSSKAELNRLEESVKVFQLSHSGIHGSHSQQETHAAWEESCLCTTSHEVRNSWHQTWISQLIGEHNPSAPVLHPTGKGWRIGRVLATNTAKEGKAEEGCAG